MKKKSAIQISWWTAAALVAANMVGTGAFTSLGFQLESISNTWSIISLWMLGGIIALFGAFSYAELGTLMSKSGGEYHYLSKIYHPFVGYLSGWVSLTVGFTAPIALSAMAMGAYTSKFLPFSNGSIAIGSIILITLVHSFSLRQSSRFQNVFTLLKIAVLFLLVFLGFWYTPEVSSFNWDNSWQSELILPAYAVSLIYVTYAYSGWNAAAYIVEEIKQPKKNLPKALISATVLVTALYILIQLAFLYQAPLEAIKGKLEVGQIVAEQMLGAEGGKIISFTIAFLLISSISAMVWVGPRVTQAMSKDHQLWKFLGKNNHKGIPVKAIWFQTAVSIALILTGTFEQVLLYSGFILQLFTAVTVLGVILVRFREKNHSGYKSPFFPWIQIIYLVVSIWVLSFLAFDRPYESLLGVFNLAIGALTYWWSQSLSPKVKRY